MTTTTSPPHSDRFLRQRGLIQTDVLRNSAVTIIGVGAIGRQVAIQLASLGVGTIQLIDFDEVESHNVTTQGYRVTDIGQSKVAAAANAIAEIDSEITVNKTEDRFRIRTPFNNIVFCCVDSISSRKAIWGRLRHTVQFWADARMLGEVMRVLIANEANASRIAYANTLFTQSEAQSGSCTSRSTIYTASIAAGLMVHQYSRWLRHLPLDNDLTFNLLSSELTQSTTPI